MGIVEGLETPPMTIEEPSTAEPSVAEEPSPIEKESTPIDEEQKSFAKEPCRPKTNELTSNTEKLICTEKELISTKKEHTCAIDNESTFVQEGLKSTEELSVVQERRKQEDDVQTIEEARTVIKQLRDRCRFQTHQALLWRKKARIQEERLTKMSSEYGTRLESLTSDLLLFEARLSRKQRAIGELLDQRECIIERQQNAIRFLHSRLADFGVTVTGTMSGGCGPTSDEGNVDDSDSAVIMEEDESGNSQEDASERQPLAAMNTGVDGRNPSRTSEIDGVSAEDGREMDGRGENVTATTYNRVMSNHRSVTKPKDVKYKRINKAKSKSLEELRGRLKNWVDRGQRMSMTVDPTYG